MNLAMIALPWVLLTCWPAFASTQSVTSRPASASTGSAISRPFEVLAIDPGDRAWGVNRLKVHVRNRTDRDRTLFVWIGGSIPGYSGFGRGRPHVIPAGQEQLVEHWYWIGPGHGRCDLKVKLTDPVSDEPWNDPAFLTRACPVTFAIPNDRCNDLIAPENVEPMKEYFPDGVGPLGPFEHRQSKQFVFYATPGTPAHKAMDDLLAEHEAALAEIVEFLGTQPPDRIVVFCYPDGLTKRYCTGHTGNGLARGNMIAMVYNKDVHLDPYHELTHVVARDLGSPPAMFAEGLAVWMQKGHVWSGRPVDATAGDLRKQDRLVPLTALLERTEIGARSDDGQVSYPQSASFVGFLIRTHGKDKFLQAYRALRNGESEAKSNAARMREIFGQSLDQLEQAWLTSLSQNR